VAGLPLYREVKEKLIQALAAGEWTTGDKLPVEGALAKRFRVGIATVRAAVGELEAAGILTRRQGKGTFVSEHTNQSRLYRFFNLVRLDGARRLTTRATVSLKRGRPDERETDLLHLSRYRNRDVWRLRSTFALDGRCVGVNDSVLPVGLFPRLTRAGVGNPGMTLYALYQSNYNINVVAVAADLHAERAPRDIAALLGVKAGHPLLKIARRAHTYGEVPAELRTSWVNTAECRFHVDQGSTV
jgi:GntR family transcriptional regulator